MEAVHPLEKRAHISWGFLGLNTELHNFEQRDWEAQGLTPFFSPIRTDFLPEAKQLIWFVISLWTAGPVYQ